MSQHTSRWFPVQHNPPPWLFSGSLVRKRESAFGGLLKHRLLDLSPRVSDSVGFGWDWHTCILASSQDMLLLLVWRYTLGPTTLDQQYSKSFPEPYWERGRGGAAIEAARMGPARNIQCSVLHRKVSTLLQGRLQLDLKGTVFRSLKQMTIHILTNY